MRDPYGSDFDATYPTLLWDGDCGFCRHSVEWILARDKKSRLRAMPYQMAPNPPVTVEVAVACGQAVHLVMPDGKMFRAGRAVTQSLQIVGWRVLPLLFSIPPFSWILELGYWFVARNRYLFSRLLFPKASAGGPSCKLPKS